jgi:hypothetical protein
VHQEGHLKSIRLAVWVLVALAAVFVLCLWPVFTCPACEGVGQVLILKCSWCGGPGKISCGSKFLYWLQAEARRVDRLNRAP